MNCYGVQKTVNTIQREVGESELKARIVQKEKRATWWEHTFDLTLQYCEPKDVSEYQARSIAQGISDYSSRYFKLQSFNTSINGNTLTARFKVSSNCGDAAEAEAAARKAVASKMRNDRSLLDGRFKLASEKKEEVTTYDAWDGIDTYA